MESPPTIVWLQACGLLLARMAPIVTLTPLFGGHATPRRFRFGIAVLLVLALCPLGISHPSASTPAQPLPFIGLLFKEAVVGLTIALLVSIVFEAFAAFGYLADTARGATFANVLDPLTQQQQSVLSVFFLQLAVCLFLASGGYRVFVGALAQSIDSFPLFLPAPESLVGASAGDTVIGLTATMLRVAFQLAAPILVVMLLIDVSLGIINRVAPSFQAYFVGMTLKGTAGLLVVVAGLALTFDTVLLDLVALVQGVFTRFGH